MSDINTLHIIPDDKFSNMVYRDFERFGYNNKYVVLGELQDYKYIKGWSPVCIKKNCLSKYITDNNIDIVIFHSLLDKFIVTRLPKNIVIVWCGWGYDYYPYLMSNLYPQGMVLTKTKIIIGSISKIKKNSFFGIIRRGYRFGRRKLLSIIYPPQKILEHIDFFIPVISSEYEMIKKMHPWLSSKYASWKYGTIEDDYYVEIGKSDITDNILVGNSATPENNHIEAFDYIYNHTDWRKRKIYCPLSYGNEEYALKIKAYGQNLFGENFVPLMTFMDKSAYNRILASCEFLVFNHIRQQALGNVISGLAMKKTLILNEINPLCSWLKKSKIEVMTLNIEPPLQPLPESILTRNKAIIDNIWSKQAIAENVQKINELLHEAVMQKKNNL